MSSENKQSDDSQIVALLLIILFLYVNPIRLSSRVQPSPKELDQHSEEIFFHVARFYGADVVPTKTILESEIERAADAYGIQRPIFKALVKVESGGNPRAVSNVGARGIAQIMPFNAKRCGLSSPDMLWDAISNLRCGAQILAEEVEEHGDYHKALTVYNCGKVRCPAGQEYASKVLSISKKLT